MIAELLEHARIEWKDKPLIFCDCEAPVALVERFRALGASTAVARQFGISGPSWWKARRPHSGRRTASLPNCVFEPSRLTPGASDLFAAALTLATAALTPLVNRAASLMRNCGLRDQDGGEDGDGAL